MPKISIIDIPEVAEIIISCFVGGADLVGIVISSRKLRASYDRPLIWRSVLSNEIDCFSSTGGCRKAGKKSGQKKKKHPLSSSYKSLFVANYKHALFESRKLIQSALTEGYEKSIRKSFYKSADFSICEALTSGILPTNETKKSCPHTRLLFLLRRTIYPERGDSRTTDKVMGSYIRCCLCLRRCYENVWVCICPNSSIDSKYPRACYCTSCYTHCETGDLCRSTGHFGHPVQLYAVPTTYLYDREYTVGCFGCAVTVVMRLSALHRSRIEFSQAATSVSLSASDTTISTITASNDDPVLCRPADGLPLGNSTFLCNSNQNDIRNMLRTEAGHADLIGRMRGNNDMILTSARCSFF